MTYNGIRYEDFETATGCGTGEGLCGWNCRHNFYPCYPGTSERNYTDQRLEELADPQTYEESRRRRALERRVRDAKRRYLAADAAGADTGRAAARLRDANRALASFRQETGGRVDAARTAVQGFGRKQAAGAEKKATPGSLRDLNPENKRVTIESISNVKRFHCNKLDAAGQLALQNAHKRLLLEAAKQPIGTEVARCYGLSMRPLCGYIVGDGESSVKLPRHDVPYIAIHNHPSGLTLSPGDIRSFAASPNMRILTAIGNNGTVYAVEKTVNFRAADALIRINEINRQIKQARNAQEGLAIMQDFLQEAEEYGFIYHT